MSILAELPPQEERDARRNARNVIQMALAIVPSWKGGFNIVFGDVAIAQLRLRKNGRVSLQTVARNTEEAAMDFLSATQAVYELMRALGAISNDMTFNAADIDRLVEWPGGRNYPDDSDEWPRPLPLKPVQR